jgi:hypothetical protein
MKSKITKKSTGKMKYGDDGIASQFILLLIGVLSGFAFYNSIIQVLLIIPNIQRIISTYWLGLALLSLFISILCGCILLGHEKVTTFDKEKYRIVQRVAGYLSIKRYLYKPRIWSLNELRSVIIEELDDGETLFYSLFLRTGSGEIIPLSNAELGGYDARQDAEKILLYVGLSIDNIQYSRRKTYELWKG